MGSRFKDASGQRFDRLVAQWPVGRSGCGTPRIVWLCLCDCGQLTTAYVNHLRRGAIRSCGCLNIEVMVKRNKTNPPSLKHGHSRDSGCSPEYNSWSGMMNRCYQINAPYYKDWGGRGIIVCERWHDFRNFLADMGKRPIGKSIDRFPNNDGNYEPTNCRWATQSEQSLNSRRSIAKRLREASA